MKVVIRADAGTQIGIGHIMRCRTLAQALRSDGASVEFVCRAHPGHLAGMLRDDGFPVHLLSWDPDARAASGLAHGHWVGADTAREIDEVGAALKVPADLLIVDHYGLDARFEQALKGHARFIMAIDDLADRTHACDLLLDQNLHSDPAGRYRGRIPPGCVTMLGPAFALLRPEFNRLRRTLEPKNGDIRRLHIFYGGSDPSGMTRRAVEAVSRIKLSGLAADIIVGAGNPDRDRLAALCSGIPGMTLHVQTTDMARLMAQADLALGAGGSTHWERCMLALPAIVTTVAANQEASSAELARRGAIQVLGSADQMDAGGLAEAVLALTDAPERVREMSRAAAAVVDPDDGLERVIAAIMGFCCERR